MKSSKLVLVRCGYDSPVIDSHLPNFVIFSQTALVPSGTIGHVTIVEKGPVPNGSLHELHWKQCNADTARKIEKYTESTLYMNFITYPIQCRYK